MFPWVFALVLALGGLEVTGLGPALTLGATGAPY